MKAFMILALAGLTTLATMIAWGAGILITFSLILVLLKLVGIALFAGVSYWLPLQLIGTCLTAGLVAFSSGIGIAVLSS